MQILKIKNGGTSDYGLNTEPISKTVADGSKRYGIKYVFVGDTLNGSDGKDVSKEVNYNLANNDVSDSSVIDENINTEELLSKLHSLKATGADIKHIVNDAHNNGYVRAGIFTKMENKTFNSNDLKDFKIEKEDFDKAIDDFMKDRKSNTRKPIGYNKQ